jgi:hypothetical protein
MSASPPAPLIWDARLCRLVPEGMVWDARMHPNGCRSPHARRACERVCPDCYPITVSEITLSAPRTGHGAF